MFITGDRGSTVVKVLCYLYLYLYVYVYNTSGWTT